MPPDIIFRPALYLGSIPFEADNLSRAAFVRNKLEVLQNFSFFKPVTLCISTSGVKVCDPDCKNVYMAHALRRISYATCDPLTSKFAFLAREANCETPCQYCHIFATDTQFQAEELNAIIGDAFKLAYAKQRMQQSTKSTDPMDSREPLPPLSSLHPVQFHLPPQSEPESGESEEKEEVNSSSPPLHIPPPPTTSPPPPTLQDISPHDREVSNQYLEETSCNGRPRWVPSGFQRHRLTDSCRANGKKKSTTADEGAGSRQRALSDPRAPCPALPRRSPSPQTSTTQPSQAQQPPPPSVRHSVAFFDTPATPRLNIPPSTSFLSASPAFIKDKNRAIFDLPLGDQPLSSTAASPVVALKTHLDSLANGGKKQSSSHKKSDYSFTHTSSSSALASGTSAVVSRFRLRQAGGSGGAGAKKRQLERPLSQIICQLDSALLLNNSPSFSIQQPRSEERLSVIVNNQSAVAEENENTTEGYDEDDVVEGVPRAVVQCLDDLENPPIPPMRIHSLRRGAGEIFGRFSHSSSSETASPHGSRSSRSGGRAPLQSLSESSGFEMLDLDPSSNGRHSTETTDEDDAEAVEFAILEAAAEAEEQAAAVGEQKRSQLGDVCSVPPLADPIITWQLAPQASDSELMSGSCPLHAGLEPSSPLHNGKSHHSHNHGHHQQQFKSTNDGCSSGTSNQWSSCMNGSRSQQQQQPPMPTQTDCGSRWTGETPTPTATPTPTPTSANLLPNVHQHIHQQQAPPPPWFQAYLPREVALELLTHEETGSFLVRDSVTQPGCWALSVRVPTHVNCMGITHYLIQRSKHGVRLKGLDKEWPSLEALITHLTVIPEMLPCPLRLPPTAQFPGNQQQHQASNPAFTEEEEDFGGLGGELEDEEYQRLSDFSSMLADMQPATTVASTSIAVAPRLFR